MQVDLAEMLTVGKEEMPVLILNGEKGLPTAYATLTV
jgi:hypothetical protein